MSGEEKRSDGLLGEHGNERRRALLAPPVLYATALLLDSTRRRARRSRRSTAVRVGAGDGTAPKSEGPIDTSRGAGSGRPAGRWRLLVRVARLGRRSFHELAERVHHLVNGIGAAGQ